MKDDTTILLSWISEWAYCKRRFYLRIQEQNLEENEYVVEGVIEHTRAHSHEIEKRGTKITVRGLPVYSEKYHLYGICDVVEFHKNNNGSWIPFLECRCDVIPIEYKHGRIRNENEYNLQMAAQAICLEDMFHCKIPTGYVYYTGSNERYEQILDEKIRADVLKISSEIMQYVQNPLAIRPELRRRCNGCSMKDLCAPKKILVKEYMERLMTKYVNDKR